MVEAAYTRASLTRKPLNPGLLLILDEAANIAPLPDLDVIAATGAGQGVQLLTILQDLAQAQDRWGRERADTIVNNHRAKIIGAGVSDTRTLEAVNRLLGDQQVSQQSSTEGDGTVVDNAFDRVALAGATEPAARERGGIGGADLRDASAGADSATALVREPAPARARGEVARRDHRRLSTTTTAPGAIATALPGEARPATRPCWCCESRRSPRARAQLGAQRRRRARPGRPPPTPRGPPQSAVVLPVPALPATAATRLPSRISRCSAERNGRRATAAATSSASATPTLASSP